MPISLDFDIKELDPSDIGNWPWPVKGVIILSLAIGLFIVGYFLDTKKQLEILGNAETEEISLRDTFEKKQHQASNLDAYKEQMTMMKTSFGSLLRQLPEKTQVPGLIEDISHQGLAAGLEFESIRLQPEKEIDFYVELPIEIAVIGNFHQFGEFVSNLASLPRIVTLHDFSITPARGDKTGNVLEMKILAKTYRYTAEEKREQ